MNNLNDNTPNAGKLILSLRSVGYDNISALADLVDNSIDADAKNIWLEMLPNKDDFRIVIADDGKGMDNDTLDQAMRLGSMTDRNKSNDLGWFGVGLITASISIARKLTVITKMNEQYLTAVHDIDRIIQSNHFEKDQHKSTDQEIALFNQYSHSATTGTVVLLENCDMLHDSNLTQIEASLKKKFGQIYRLFIRAGLNLYVRENKVNATDPLMENEGAKITADDSFEIDTDGGKETIRVKISFLPKEDAQTSRMLEINQTNQGFYLLRNNREIAAGETLGIFTKHNITNRFRAEIYYSGNLDSEMKTDFKKKGPSPKQSIIDKILSIAYPQISTIKRMAEADSASKNITDNDIDLDKAAKIVTSKSKLLIKPEAKLEMRRPGTTHGTVHPTDTGKERTPHGETQSKQLEKMDCEFLRRDYGPTGQLFEADIYGKRIQIVWNVSHPFYKQVIVEHKGDQDLVNAVQFLVYSLASAKLKFMAETNEGIFDSFFTMFSANLRTLLN